MEAGLQYFITRSGLEMLESKIKLYLSMCEDDASLKEFARKRPIVIQYRIPDKDIQFYMAFKDGLVRTGW
jgi:hypothetical protein